MRKDNEYEYSINDTENEIREETPSIVEKDGELTVENFESAIACGSSKNDMCIIFNMDSRQLDAWCDKVYGLHFDEAYSRVLRMMKNDFVKALSVLARNGNNSAMNIVASFLTHYSDNNSEGVNIINNVPGGVVINGKEEKE